MRTHPDLLSGDKTLICYTDNNVLMTDSEGKLKELERVVKERLTINCKKMEFMAACEMDCPKWEIHISILLELQETLCCN